MKRNRWTPERIAILVDNYPVSSDKEVADLTGMSPSAVRKKAKKLGLCKYHNKIWMERAEIIRSNFQTHSYAELAKMVGISKSDVRHYIKELGLRRTRKEMSLLIQKSRLGLLARERSRIRLSLRPISKVKIGTNRQRIWTRSRLKALGYGVARGSRDVFYHPGSIRYPNTEALACKYGLHILPDNHDSNLTIAI